ncbi:hypothetical protein HPB51_001146 [Rhipicephalus microplus]|uniref:Uncharacterized protein n=1 Tax=Rhipicephalus microplus TaxID=6941 RepID=A0A9J6EV29_RHIMP|nr:hypothetical protein HPB51_001146 [Rhipicephalus microplus]
MSSSSGNCTKDMVSILNATTVVAQVDAASTLTDMRRSSILEPHDDHDYTHPENFSAVVVRQVCKTTTCDECIAALYSDELVPLVEQKNRGGLVSPFKDVIGLCEAIEKGLRRLQIECGTLQAVNSQSKRLVSEVLRLSVEEKCFQKLEQHILDLDPLDNHIYSLCKKVAELYEKIRIPHMTKERNREIIKDRVRPVLSRLIIFKHHCFVCEVSEAIATGLVQNMASRRKRGLTEDEILQLVFDSDAESDICDDDVSLDDGEDQSDESSSDEEEEENVCAAEDPLDTLPPSPY